MEDTRKYAPKELASEIGIPESTLRRWCKVLEDVGHTFEREQQKRLFTQHDVDLLRVVQEQMSTPAPGLTLDEACRRAIHNRDSGHVNLASLTQEEIAAKARFEQLLQGLAERIYWSGAEMAVQELQTAYAEIEMGRDDR
jgi:DNA-binding transcriptional MerR regulator